MNLSDNENAMIGTSGKMIRPKLYIGLGVSGSAHHICGMKDSSAILDELLRALKG
ncbi:MAG: FAD-binding protein [Spirochaetaceae bacterium]|jgi:electron transfer flavoprotein alpha subunit|nr:FAD-binding protein [Spirochaetaceae bacterium]